MFERDHKPIERICIDLMRFGGDAADGGCGRRRCG